MKYSMDIAAIVYRDITEICEYIRMDRPSAAKKIGEKIYAAIEKLADNPFSGVALSAKFDIDTDFRMKVVRPYIIFYKVEGEIVGVRRVLDGRRDYLKIL